MSSKSDIITTVKAKIHPEWYPKAKVVCACGHTFTVGSTKPEIHVDLCSACHPFFTGQMKFVDTQGRVERFQQKQKFAAAANFQKKQKLAQAQEKTQTLREMLHLEK